MSQAPNVPQAIRTPSNLNVPGAAPASSKTLTRPDSHSNLRHTVEHDDDLVPHSRSVSRRNSVSDLGAGSASPQPTSQPSHLSSQPTPVKRTPTMNSPGAPVSTAAHAGLVPLLPGSMQAGAENAALTAPVDWYVDALHHCETTLKLLTAFQG